MDEYRAYITKYISKLFLEESTTLFVWAPVFLAMGVLLSISGSVVLHNAQILCLITLLLSVMFIFRNRYIIRLLLIAILLVIMGVLAMQYRIDSIDTNMLPSDFPKAKVFVTGKISDITGYRGNNRIILDHVKIRLMRHQDYGEYNDHIVEEINKKIANVRINVRSSLDHVTIGDRVGVCSMLHQPSHPITPEGFDFYRYAFFKRISAVGYAVGQLKLLKNSDNSGFSEWVMKCREYVSKSISKYMEHPEYGVATALSIGKSSIIERSTYENIRIVGLAHIVAISGMHMAIVVFIIFQILRFILSRFEYITLHHNVKKVSALLTITLSLLYLMLSGAAVSAQRAFVMSTILLSSIIFDRDVDPLRSLAIAAILIICIEPEDILNPGFQMSFAACLALIAGFQISKKITFFQSTRSDDQHMVVYYLHKFAVYFVSIIVATLIGGFATAPFVAYHFHQFSQYSLIANLLCIPINDFIIMPLVVFTLFLMILPFDLYAVTLWPMKYSITVMLFIVDKIAVLPYASLYTNAVNSTTLIFVTITLLMLCMFTSRLKVLAIIPLVISVLISNPKLPDIMISKENKIFAIHTADNRMIVPQKNRARYIQGIWKEYFGDQVVNIKEVHHDDRYINVIKNDKEKGYCIVNLKNHHIVIVYGEIIGEEEVAKIIEKENIDILINLYADDVFQDIRGVSKVVTTGNKHKDGVAAVYL